MGPANHQPTSERVLEILVAEDNPDDVFLLEEAFRKAGSRSNLHTVSDGCEAVQYLKGEGQYAARESHPFPDVLLLDLNMPRMNGLEVLEWLRSDSGCSGLIVHILTASCRPVDVSKAYELGANSYVVKPARLKDLVAFAAALQEWHRFVVRAPVYGSVPA